MIRILYFCFSVFTIEYYIGSLMTRLEKTNDGVIWRLEASSVPFPLCLLFFTLFIADWWSHIHIFFLSSMCVSTTYWELYTLYLFLAFLYHDGIVWELITVHYFSHCFLLASTIGSERSKRISVCSVPRRTKRMGKTRTV